MSRIFVFIVIFLFPLGSAFAAPERIVSLKPNITEILFAVGAGDRVVGVTKYCDFPDEAKKLPRVADYVKPFAERIINLRPDLVIGSQENSSRKSIHILNRMGFRVELFPFSTVEETLNSIRGIARLVGLPDEGKALSEKIRADLDRIRESSRGKRTRRVLVVWGQRPMVVAGGGSYMNELLQLVSAENVAAQGKKRYPHWSSESVIAKNPDVIIDLSMGSESTDGEVWKDLSTVNAVKNNRVYKLDADMFSRPGPRLPAAVGELANIIYH